MMFVLFGHCQLDCFHSQHSFSSNKYDLVNHELTADDCLQGVSRIPASINLLIPDSIVDPVPSKQVIRVKPTFRKLNHGQRTTFIKRTESRFHKTKTSDPSEANLASASTQNSAVPPPLQLFLFFGLTSENQNLTGLDSPLSPSRTG